jgi:antitoxin (DNA-binding transcriptional repressor) of toxin-antitoxin stability system
MQIISKDEAESNLTGLLDSVEAGEEFVIARGQKLIAKLVPFGSPSSGPRPKVGTMISPPFEVPHDAVAPLNADELKNWGL